MSRLSVEPIPDGSENDTYESDPACALVSSEVLRESIEEHHYAEKKYNQRKGGFPSWRGGYRHTASIVGSLIDVALINSPSASPNEAQSRTTP
jgi:hypothetical protein